MIRNLTRLISIIKDFNNEENFADIRLSKVYARLVRTNHVKKSVKSNDDEGTVQ